MSDIPHYRLYGDGDPSIENSIQPQLELREWDGMTVAEKRIALKEVTNRGWLEEGGWLLETIEYLNQRFLRDCPGKALHSIKPDMYAPTNASARRKAAKADFEGIFVDGSAPLVYRMLTRFAQSAIAAHELAAAKKSATPDERKRHVDAAFQRFDRFANALNHIFSQFAVNQQLTRCGLVPRQDEQITTKLYEPTLRALSDPKWSSVSEDLRGMFSDYRQQNYPEVITKAHAAVQRFLQIAVGEEGKSGKGELAKLFADAKRQGLIPVNRFIEPVVAAILGFIPAERATNSTAKPAVKLTTPADALLMMNVVMVLLQYCLQNERS